jgi:diacylglycerol kinase family enzyme
VYVLKGHSRWIIAKEWARLALGVPFRPGDTEILSASTLRIDTFPKQDVAVDGEVVAQTPVRVSVARNALLLMVPRTYQDF